MVVNSSDRIIRTIHLPEFLSSSSKSSDDATGVGVVKDTNGDVHGDGNVDVLNPKKMALEVEHKFQDVVNRLSWNHVAFSSSTGEYVMASTYKNHDVYVWERSRGSLVKILEGPKEELGVVEVSYCITLPCIHSLYNTSLSSSLSVRLSIPASQPPSMVVHPPMHSQIQSTSFPLSM